MVEKAKAAAADEAPPDILQTFSALQGALTTVKGKKKDLDAASEAQTRASMAYTEALAAAQVLKDQLQATLEEMLPDNRVRVS